MSRAGKTMAFENLRDPVGFSWIQIRALVPGWFGVGTALNAEDAEGRSAADFAAGHAKSPFLGTLLANTSQRLARAAADRSAVCGIGRALGRHADDRGGVRVDDFGGPAFDW